MICPTSIVFLASLDLSLVGWVMLLLSRCLDSVGSILNGEDGNDKSSGASASGGRDKEGQCVRLIAF